MAEEKTGILGKGLKLFLGDTVSFTILDYLKGLAKGFGDKARDTLHKKIDDLIKDNPRADLLYVLLSLDPADAEKLWHRHLSANRSGLAGAENDFVSVLGQALPRDAQGKIDMERAKQVFSQIAQMDDDKFCQVMEELKHDPIAQHIRHWLKHGESLAEALVEGVAYSAGVVTRWGEQINQRAEQRAQQMNKTSFGRLAKWLIK